MSARRRLCPAAGSLLAATLLLSWAAPSVAVILASDDGQGNTTAPADDFGFANVGAVRESGVYIGNGWVLTANHVKARDIRFGDRVYPPVPRSKKRLTNEGPGVSPDIALFRLREPLPDLPRLSIRETPPKIGEQVILMGNGPNRGETTIFEGHHGWIWAEGKSLRWGTNQVSAIDLRVQASAGDLTTSFATRLSLGRPTEYEATVGIGDSGGGAFIHDDGRWQLAGVLFATSTFDRQPPQTTLFGNLTYVADLSHYRDQVLAIAGVPACRDGLDDDGDGKIDFPADTGCTHPDDRQETAVCTTGRVTGDANRDGRADGHDYAIWTEHLGDTGDPLSLQGEDRGDFDCDGLVDERDFEIWREQYRREPEGPTDR